MQTQVRQDLRDHHRQFQITAMIFDSDHLFIYGTHETSARRDPTSQAKHCWNSPA